MKQVVFPLFQFSIISLFHLLTSLFTILHHVSSIQYKVSSIQHRAGRGVRILYLASCISFNSVWSDISLLLILKKKEETKYQALLH
ncbi:hypothetical protein ACFL6A_01505 [bacterium]